MPSRVARTLLVILALVPEAGAGEEPVREFERACGLAASGEPSLALDLFSRIADENPAWIAAHHALVMTALEIGGDPERELRAQLARRVRRSSRDVGASVGRALFLARDGDMGEAHRLLLSATLAGARDPLLPELLVTTTADAPGLVTWLRIRGENLPGDAAFAAVRAGVLGRLGRIGEALEATDRALARAPSDPWLLSQRTDFLRAAGREAESCASAELGEGRVVARGGIAQDRVPRRIALVRAYAACGRLDDAQRLIAGHGPLLAPPGLPDPAGIVHATQAELLLARGRPVEALARLERGTGDDPRARAIARAVRMRALAEIGIEPQGREAALSEPSLPGVLAAEHAMALASLVRAHRDRRLADASRLLAGSLERSGLDVRARRLELVAAWASREPPPLAADASAELRVARDLVLAAIRLDAGDADGALEAAQLDPIGAAGAPGSVIATLRVIAARAALRAGDPGRAAAATKEGQLDLQEADRTGARAAPEIEGLSRAVLGGADAAVLLSGLAYRAARASGRELDASVSELLAALDRSVRGWSTQPWGWPTRLADLEAALPDDACLVVATGAGGDDAVAVGSTVTRSGSSSTIVREPPCADVSRVLWLGPHPAPGGLSPDDDGERILVRIAGLGSGAPRRDEPRPRRAALVGPGGRGALLRTVAPLAGLDPASFPAGGRAQPPDPAFWPVWTGPGLTIPGRPQASGWTVPGDAEDGGATWFGPEAIATLDARPGEGLVALGLRSLPNPGPDRGAWVVAEAALASGRPFALLSREPLTNEEAERLAARQPRLALATPRALRELLRDEPELSQRLAFWSLPGRWHDAPGPFPWLPLLGLLAAVSATAAIAIGLRRRRR